MRQMMRNEQLRCLAREINIPGYASVIVTASEVIERCGLAQTA